MIAPAPRAFIQARMSSARFPGKVLAPFDGRPLVSAVIDRVARVVGRERVVVATSDDPTDDPLACYVASVDCAVFRGDLTNVLRRFRDCLAQYPCQWFYRVCADSPLLDPALLARAADMRADGVDLITNVFPRTFPKGQSVELLNAATFAAVPLDAAQCEHVTAFYYEQPQRFGIRNFEAAVSGGDDMAVDTVEDLHRLTQRLQVSA